MKMFHSLIKQIHVFAMLWNLIKSTLKSLYLTSAIFTALCVIQNQRRGRDGFLVPLKNFSSYFYVIFYIPTGYIN